MGRFWAWLNRQRHVAAQGLVEYALILVLIAVVVVGALSVVGKKTTDKLDNVQCQVNETGTGAPPNCP
ncbi:MAG: Flp family type IVb pilin [Herpetosiphonaceae bacterium]|nr:Flp family type IVb pilin [Herpetosiphonaceae bacterium]MBA3469346.1 Flp family type IVb pilin [Herpetosiphonaceae bacterium]